MQNIQRMIRRGGGVAALVLGMSSGSPVSADILEFQYSAPGGVMRSPEPPAHVYGAQANTMSVALSGPAGGRVEALLLDHNGNTVSRADSQEIVPGEYSLLSSGERYTGYPITLDLPASAGHYTLVSREKDASGTVVASTKHDFEYESLVGKPYPSVSEITLLNDRDDMRLEALARLSSASDFDGVHILHERDLTGGYITVNTPEEFISEIKFNLSPKDNPNDENEVVSTLYKGKAEILSGVRLNTVPTSKEYTLTATVTDIWGGEVSRKLNLFYHNIGNLNTITQYPRVFAVYDERLYEERPDLRTSLEGYVYYSSGMTLYTNVIKPIIYILAEDYKDNKPMGFGYPPTNPGRHSQYTLEVDFKKLESISNDRYVFAEGEPVSFAGKSKTIKYAMYTPNTQSQTTVSVKLHDEILDKPITIDELHYKLTRSKYEFSTFDGRFGPSYSGDTIEYISLNIEPQDDDVTATVTSSESDETVVGTIPAGASSFTIPTTLSVGDAGQEGSSTKFTVSLEANGVTSSESFYVNILPTSLELKDITYNDRVLKFDVGFESDTVLSFTEFSIRSKSTGEWKTLRINSSKELSTTILQGSVNTHSLEDGEYDRIRLTVVTNPNDKWSVERDFALIQDTEKPYVKVSPGDNPAIFEDFESIRIMTSDLGGTPITRVEAYFLPDEEYEFPKTYLTLRRYDDGIYGVEPIDISGLPTAFRMDFAAVAYDDAGNKQSNIHMSYMIQTELEPRNESIVPLPAIAAPFYSAGGEDVIQSEQAVPLVEEQAYPLVATLKDDAAAPFIINGVQINPGETVTVSEQYRLMDHDNRIAVSGYPAVDGVVGLSDLHLELKHPYTAYTLDVTLSTWAPEVSLSANAWTAKQLIDLIEIEAVNHGESKCTVTFDIAEASLADPHEDPVCLLEWTQLPPESEVIDPDYNDTFISKVVARGMTLGEQQVSYNLFLYSATGERFIVGSGSETLTIEDASDTIETNVVPEISEIPRLIRPVSGVIRQESGNSCLFFSEESLARDYASSQPLDSTRLACFVRIEELPEGLAERPGTWPGFDGSPTTLGEQTLKWNVVAYSPSGREANIGSQTYTFTTVEPATPLIDLLTDSSDRRAFEAPESDSGGMKASAASVPELTTIPYGERQLGQIYYKTGPGALDVSVALADTPLVEDRYGMPMSTRERLLMSRIPTEEVYPLWSTLQFQAHAEYTEHAAIQATKQFEAVVVPGEKVQPYLSLLQDDREVLNTAEAAMRVTIDDPQFEGGYSRERMGEWEVRIVEEQRRDEYVPVTEFVAADTGTVDFNVELTAGDSANLRLLAEARLISPIEGYERTEYSSSPVYVTILEGKPLEASIATRYLSGPKPFNSLFKLEFADTDGLRASGDIEWRVRKAGGEWETDGRSIDDRLRLRKEVNFDETGTYEVEAVVTNQYSGAISVTDRASIVVYDVPELTLEGPRTAFVGDDLTVRAVPANAEGEVLPADQFDILWSTDLGKNWFTSDGAADELVLSSDEEASLNAWVKIKQVAAPEDDRYAWTQESTGVSFRDFKPINVNIVGPRQVETGVLYDFEVSVREPYISFNRELKGYFTLPDGTKIEDTSFQYAPTDSDLENGTLDITYTGWADGYREESEAQDVYNGRVWEYNWPVWGMYVKANASVAPSEILLRIRQITRSNKLEGLQYAWQLDPAFDVTQSYSDVMRQLVAPEPGDYEYRVRIWDERGNETILQETLNYGEPEPFTIEQRQYFSNRYMRAPLEVSVSPRVAGGHPRDRVSRFEFEVDGQLADSASRYLRTPLSEGSHDVTVRLISDFGEVVEQTETVTVVPNIPPVCEMRSTDNMTTWRYRSDCRDEDGRVVDYEWTLNGEVIDLRSYGLSISKGQYPASPHVKLRAVDDSGDYSAYVTN